MKTRIWNQLFVICLFLGIAASSDELAPVYIPTAPRHEALTAAEDIDSDVGLPTVTVRGFLNFRTTVDGTVIVFTPASADPPTNEQPSSTLPAASPAPTLSPRNDNIQHLDYSGATDLLENEAEDDRQGFRQRHLKYDGVTTPQDEEPRPDPLQKAGGATPHLPQYPTGLVTVLGGTHVKDGATTVFETKVIGTYIEGKYAQILQSTSQIIFPARASADLLSPTLLQSVSPNNNHIESSTPKQKGDNTKEYKHTPTPHSKEDNPFLRPSSDEPVRANTVLQSSFELPDSPRPSSSRPTQSLSRPTTASRPPSRRQQPRPTLATDVPPEEENTVPQNNGHRNGNRHRYMLPRRNTPTVRLNRFKVKLTVRDGASDAPHQGVDHHPFDPEEDLLEEYDVDPARVVYEKTTITSEVTLHVGRRKSVRTLTITTSVPRHAHHHTDAPPPLLDASPAHNNNVIFATPLDDDQIVVTRTYTTTERMLKTSVVPVFVEGDNATSYHTVTESFFILKLITGYKTMPASDVTAAMASDVAVGDTEFDPEDPLSGLLDGAVVQPSRHHHHQHVVQTPVPNGLLQASGSGREQAVVPYNNIDRDADLSNSLMSLGAALQQNPLAAVYLGLQQLNKQATQYSTVTKTSTYVHTDTVYSTKVVSFYDGRRTRTRTLSESLSTSLRTLTSLTTTVTPYINTQLNHLQQLLGGPQAPLTSYSTVTSTYTTVTTATDLSTRVYTLIYNALSTKFRTVTSTSLYETTITATTTSEVPLAPITAPPGGVFPFLG